MKTALCLFLVACSVSSCEQPPTVPIPPSGPDTTSHEFVWHVERIGAGGSYFRDVAVINDTLAIAVGKISAKDSTGQWQDIFNMARWDGREWHLERLTVNFRGYPVTTILQGIWAFSKKDIWITNGLLVHFDGANWTLYDLRPTLGDDSLSLYTCWGTSTSDMYFAGYNGSMVHFDGNMWQKMELGTRRTITDVCGSPDGSMIWALVTNPNQPDNLLYGMERATKVWRLAYDGTSLQYSISLDSLSGGMNGIYAPDPQTVFVCSSAGLYRLPDRGSTLPRAERMSFTVDWFPGYPWKLRGNSATDMFIVGERAFVAHYNGRSVRFYNELSNPNLYLFSVSCKGDLVMAVGEDYDPIDSKGLVIWGRRLSK